MGGQLLIAGPYRPGTGLPVGDLTDAEFDILHSLAGGLGYFEVLKLPRAPEISTGDIVQVPLRPALVRRSRLWNDTDVDDLAWRWAEAEEMSGAYVVDELRQALEALRQAAGPMGAGDDVRLVFTAEREEMEGP